MMRILRKGDKGRKKGGDERRRDQETTGRLKKGKRKDLDRKEGRIKENVRRKEV